MLTLADLGELARFRGGDLFAISFYLNLEEAGRPRKAYLIAAKDLLKQGPGALGGARTREQRASLDQDRERIQSYLREDLPRKGHRGLALFSCTGRGLFSAFPLRRPVADRLVIKSTLSLRPLSLLLDENPRYCLVLVDRMKAKVIDVTLGEIGDSTVIWDEVPKQVSEGGWHGYEEARIRRHIEDHVHRHYKNVADRALDLFKRNQFERLLLGGQQQVLAEFERWCHTYLRDRVVGRFTVDSEAALSEALKRGEEVAREFERAEEDRLARQCLEEAGARRRGLVGLGETLAGLLKREVHGVLVEKGFSHAGIICRGCDFIGLAAGPCPLCGGEVEGVEDVVDEVIRTAHAQGCRVEHLEDGSLLHEAGRIGALLRYRA